MNEAQIIREIVGKREIVFKVCTVDTVNDVDCDVTPVDSESQLKKVRLKTHMVNDSGIVIKPKKNSLVVVALLKPADAVIIMYDEVDSVSVKIGDTTLFMDKDHIIFNGGELKGLTKIEDLVDKLNNIEKDINALKDVFTNWKVVAQDGGAALKAQVGSWMTQKLTETGISDLENDKITHG